MKLSGLMLGVLLLLPSVARAQLVQQMASPNATAISPSALVLPANSTINNLLTVECVTRDSAGTQGPLPTLSGLATTWTLQADSGTGNNQRAIIWTGVATSAGTTVNATFSGGTTPKVSCSIQEWQPYTHLDKSGAAENTSTGISSPVLSTTQPVDLVLIVGGHNVGESPTSSPTAPWIALNGVVGSVPQYAPFYQITSATGSYSASWAWPTTSDNGSAAIAMFSLIANGAISNVQFR